MDLHVVSFNIRCCNDPDGHAIVERAPRLADAVLSERPDIIGFQECSPKWEPELDAVFTETYDMYRVHRAPDDGEGCVILWDKSKFTCLDRGCFWLSDTPEVPSKGWDDKYHCYRICIWTVLKDTASGRTFNFLCTHYGFGDVYQCASADLIARYLKQIGERPTCLVGDFNLRPTAPGYAQLCKHFTDTNVGNDLGPTYHGYHRDPDRMAHIDYGFVNDGFTPVSQTLIQNEYDGKYPSDHDGLSIWLTW